MFGSWAEALSGSVLLRQERAQMSSATVAAGGVGMAVRLLMERKDGTWGWHLEADNGQIIATDGNQGYENEGDARDMADRIIGGEFKDADKKIRRQK